MGKPGTCSPIWSATRGQPGPTATSPCAPATPSARHSAGKVVSAPRCRPTDRDSSLSPRPGDRRYRLRVSRTWVWPSPDTVVDLLFPVAVQRARLLLAQGEFSAAAHWTATRGLGVEDEPSYLREREYLVLARVLLGQGEHAQALRLLERLHEEAEAAGRTGSTLEILSLQALALWVGGEIERAVSVLSRALSIAEPEGYVRTFVDEGPQMAALLSEVLEAQQ